ncbi:MAG: hypothetical protein KF836_11050 [Fimbriimonadaceae bacterium]|nr:hypothetical protein [Fimbriimonadaceae bacterium]
MVRTLRAHTAFAIALATLTTCLAPVIANAQIDKPTHPILADLKWRSVGPYKGGRSSAVSGVIGDPKTFYMGTTGGGLWKTTDEGETWACVSDGYFRTGTVGSIAVAPSNTNVIYVGMGEHAIRGNITHGDGIYKSEDAGKTWKHMGLEKTQYTGRIRVHPTNPDIVWVAALGPVFGKSPDRGIYKSTDGGKTWKKTLYVGDETGGIDLTIDPKNPDNMYAAMWEMNRRPWTFNSGGKGSGLWYSKDGGVKWEDVSRRPGLPKGLLGKIGISYSPVDNTRMYSVIESTEGNAIYSSDDTGKTWTKTSDNANLLQRPWYYNYIYADPVDKDTVYVLNVSYGKSTNGGKTFSMGSAGHSDHHDMWIDPSDNTRLVMANDGGAAVSVNGGRRWSDQDFPTGQFYHVSVDNAFPYNLLGAQQDNSTVRVPSRTTGLGITSDDWTNTAGGESGYAVAKPDNPDIVIGANYGGSMVIRDHRNNMSWSIDPWPDNPLGRGAFEAVERFQWTYPIVFSPHNPNVIYVGSQHVLRSTNMGQSWERISPDLTTNDVSKMQPAGGQITQDSTGVEVYCTVFTIAESPITRGLIWAGSDDGLIHVTRNDGANWINVTPKGMPKNGRVSMIEASPFRPGTAYAAVNNYQQNDFRPYIFVTRDYGATWTEMVSGIATDDFVRAVREDPSAEGVLYAATEVGVYTSSGSTWSKMGGLPEVPVHDLVVKGNDLVIATHGRGFYILDNLMPARNLANADVNKVTVFPAFGNPTRVGPVGVGDVGKNPSGSGLQVQFWSPEEADTAQIIIRDQEGFAVASTKTSVRKGLNAVYLMPNYPGMQSFRGLLMWSGYTGSLKAPPGKYKTQVVISGSTYAGVATWSNHPASTATDEEMVAKYKLSREVADATTEANRIVLRCRGWRTAIQESIKGSSTLEKTAKPILEMLDQIENALHQGKAKSGQDFLNYPMQLNNRLAALIGNVQSGDFGPTKQSYDVFAILKALLDVEIARINAVEKDLVPEFNTLLKANGRPELAPKFEELMPARGGASDANPFQEYELPTGDGDGN